MYKFGLGVLGVFVCVCLWVVALVILAHFSYM